MRAYFFVNSALSGTQKGLQVAHCAVELAHNLACWNEDCPTHFHSSEERLQHGLVIREWAEKHKTIIVLEGGFHADLLAISELLRSDHRDGGHHNMAIADFREDEETMNGMMTAVGIILPERIYEAAKTVRENKSEWVCTDAGEGDYIANYLKFCLPKGGWSDNFTLWEVELIKLLNSRPLAR